MAARGRWPIETGRQLADAPDLRYHPKKRELQAEWPEALLMNTRRLRLSPIQLGVQMAGTGAVWIDNVSIDVIGPYATAHAEQVFPTVYPRPDPQTLSPTPQNLNFEQ